MLTEPRFKRRASVVSNSINQLSSTFNATVARPSAFESNAVPESGSATSLVALPDSGATLIQTSRSN